ncbi:MAG: ABC transporter substrate-binding protein, partial [Chloroflexota bacterium]
MGTLTRRSVIRNATLVAAGVGAAACRSIGREAPAARPAVTFPAELTWMPWSAHNQWLTPTYEEVAGRFTERHPQTKLTLLPTPADWLVKLKTSIAAGTPPDVSDVHHGGQVRDLGPSGQVIDLTPFLKRDAYPKTYVGWEPYRWLDKQYGVPWALQSTAIFYNKPLFESAGVPFPTDRWTWDDFVDAARRLTKLGADDDNTTWGAADQGGRNYQWVNALLAGFGGGILKADYAECVMTATAALAGLEFRAGWGPKLRIARTQPGGASGQFTSGKVAMATSGSWFVANVKQSTNSQLLTAQVPWDVAPVPRGKTRRAALAHELGVGIPAGARHPDASWAAIRYLTAPESLQPFARIGRILPPERGIWKDAVPADGLPAGFKHAFLDVWDEIAIEPPFV